MAATNRNLPVLDRKEWQMMTPAPVTTSAAMNCIAPPSYLAGKYPVMLVASATVVYLYSPDEDGWVQVPSPALAGFGAGACGAFSPWSITYTATGGSTTTVTVSAATHNLTSTVVGKTVEFLSAGTATGQRRVVTGIDAGSGAGAGTITLTLDYPLATAVLNNHTFRVASGRYFVMSAGTVAAGTWKVWDHGTGAWQANLATTNLPATWGTDGRAVGTARHASVLANGTATAGTTTTLTDSTANWAINQWAGDYVLTVSGTGAGQCLKVASNTATTLTFAAATAPASGTVYQLRGLSALAVGTATSGSATTLVNSAKTWTANQWTNYQVRIIAGAGAGDKRRITANDATTLTVASGTALDNTSVYEIEPNEDSVYLGGNNASALYLYSISGNTWSVVAPTTARSGNLSTGGSLDFVSCTGDPLWGAESAIQDGRYLYSFRGGSTVTLDRFDIAGGTSGAGTWTTVTYPGASESFTTGSSGCYAGRYLYLRKEATNRFFKYDVPGNEFLPLNTDTYPDGGAVLGLKLWVKSLDSTENIQWLYSLGNSGTVLRRLGII